MVPANLLRFYPQIFCTRKFTAILPANISYPQIYCESTRKYFVPANLLRFYPQLCLFVRCIFMQFIIEPSLISYQEGVCGVKNICGYFRSKFAGTKYLRVL